jgi:hypothetical protein
VAFKLRELICLFTICFVPHAKGTSGTPYLSEGWLGGSPFNQTEDKHRNLAAPLDYDQPLVDDTHLYILGLLSFLCKGVILQWSDKLFLAIGDACGKS